MCNLEYVLVFHNLRHMNSLDILTSYKGAGRNHGSTKSDFLD